MSEIRLLVVDDHEVIRQGVRSVLTQYVGWEVCGEAVDGEDAIAKAKCLNPDVIILDIRMPKLGGLEAAKAIKTQLPKTKDLVPNATRPCGHASSRIAIWWAGLGVQVRHGSPSHTGH